MARSHRLEAHIGFREQGVGTATPRAVSAHVGFSSAKCARGWRSLPTRHRSRRTKNSPRATAVCAQRGRVRRSSSSRFARAASRSIPHIVGTGRKRRQTSGRSERPKIAQRKSSVSCTQGTPAGFPCGMPGIGEEIDGAMQQAPQPARHSISGFRAQHDVDRRRVGRAAVPHRERLGGLLDQHAESVDGDMHARIARDSEERA